MEDLPIPPEIEESKFKKIITRIGLIVVALFLILLVLSYIIPGSSVLSVIEGRLVSHELDENLSVVISGITIKFTQEAYDALQEHYFANVKHETKVCLLGDKKEQLYLITGISIPEIISQSVFQVTSEGCGKDALISLHTHPYKKCVPSQQDHRSHTAFARTNPDGLSVLMCEPTRFTFYGDST